MKPWLTWSQQLALMVDRGLTVDDEVSAEHVLSSVNYYRLSGYARYFQVAPEAGENRFRDGVTFEQIWALYDLDARLRALLMPPLAKAETLLRTHYAYVVGREVGPCGKYLDEAFFSGASTSEPLGECCRKDLGRSHERYIHRYAHPGDPDPYAELPIWSAVEAFSFGTLSKCIERGWTGQMAGAVADGLGVAKAGFASRVRSLVYLRNRCAHHSRLWNHSVLDAGGVPKNVRFKVKKAHGKFAPRSILDVLVSLDDILKKSGVGSSVVEDTVVLAKDNSEFWRGLVDPVSPRDAYGMER